MEEDSEIRLQFKKREIKELLEECEDIDLLNLVCGLLLAG